VLIESKSNRAAEALPLLARLRPAMLDSPSFAAHIDRLIARARRPLPES